jgi:leader peptidase (prepilin peptidase) / N-methyltransferase
MPVLIVAVVLLGLAVGSFLNVVVYRVPTGGSLIHPPSHCPCCGHPIRKRHNIPVLGWLMLRGRCADCRASISVRYPLVELVTALLFVAITLRIASLDLLPALPAYLYFAAIGIALTLIDIDCRRLPNVIVLPSYPVVLVLLASAAAWQHDLAALVRALVGTAALFGVYFLLAMVHPAGMGFGDVKLAGVLGAALAYLSYSALVVGAFAAFFIAALVGVVLIVSRRASRKTAIPFGPYMIAGSLLAMFFAEPIAQAYLKMITGDS